MSKQSLFEKYRPHDVEDVVGQDKAVKMLKRCEAGGKAFLFSGPTGKTTLAWWLARTIADDFAITEVDAARDCNLDFLRSVEDAFQYRALGTKAGKAWIINECHAMRGTVLSSLLTLLEPIPEHCCIIFTTTRRPQTTLFADHDDADPFVSRCLRVPLAWHEFAPDAVGPLTKAFAQKALTIARAEGLDGRPIGEYERLALDCKHNLRRMLSEIESGCMLPS